MIVLLTLKPGYLWPAAARAHGLDVHTIGNVNETPLIVGDLDSLGLIEDSALDVLGFVVEAGHDAGNAPAVYDAI